MKMVEFQNISCKFCRSRLPTELVEMMINGHEIVCERCGYTLSISDYSELQTQHPETQLKEHKEKDIISRIIEQVDAIKEKSRNKEAQKRERQEAINRGQDTNQQDTRIISPYDSQQVGQTQAYQQPGSGQSYPYQQQFQPQQPQQYNRWDQVGQQVESSYYASKIKKYYKLSKLFHVLGNIAMFIVFFITIDMATDLGDSRTILISSSLAFWSGLTLIVGNIIYRKYKDTPYQTAMGLDELFVGIISCPLYGLGVFYILSGIFLIRSNSKSLNRNLAIVKNRVLDKKQKQYFRSLYFLNFTYRYGLAIAIIVVSVICVALLVLINSYNGSVAINLMTIIACAAISIMIRQVFVINKVKEQGNFKANGIQIAMLFISSFISMVVGIGFVFFMEAIYLSIYNGVPFETFENFFSEAQETPLSKKLQQDLKKPFLTRASDTEQVIFNIRPIENSGVNEIHKQYDAPNDRLIKRFDPVTGLPLKPQSQDAAKDDERKPEYIPNFEDRIFTVLSDEVRYKFKQLNISEEEKTEILHAFIYLNEEEQLKYIDEFRLSNEGTKQTLIDRINSLNIDENHKKSLIKQLEFLDEQEQENFVNYLEKSAKGATA